MNVFLFSDIVNEKGTLRKKKNFVLQAPIKTNGKNNKKQKKKKFEDWGIASNETTHTHLHSSTQNTRILLYCTERYLKKICVFFLKVSHTDPGEKVNF